MGKNKLQLAAVLAEGQGEPGGLEGRGQVVAAVKRRGSWPENSRPRPPGGAWKMGPKAWKQET